MYVLCRDAYVMMLAGCVCMPSQVVTLQRCNGMASALSMQHVISFLLYIVMDSD